MYVVDPWEASLTTIPVGTIGALGPDATDPLVAYITRSGMFFRSCRILRPLFVEQAFKISVNDGVEGVLDRMGCRYLIPQHTIGTEIIIGAILVISLGENMGWIRAYLALVSYTLDSFVAAITAYMFMSVFAGPGKGLRVDRSWLLICPRRSIRYPVANRVSGRKRHRRIWGTHVWVIPKRRFVCSGRGVRFVPCHPSRGFHSITLCPS